VGCATLAPAMRRGGPLWWLVVALLLRVPSAEAAAFEVKDTSWEGCSTFLDIARAEVGERRAIPLSHLDWSDLKPEDALLLLHPEHALSGDKLAAFLGDGGRAAVVDDYGAGDEILERFQIERVPAPSRPFAMLRKNPELAVAEPVRESTDRGGAVHTTVQDVERLITNHPTGLRNPKLTPVLRIRSVDEPDVLLALAGNFGTPPRGKLFAMGDPSALTNQMLRYPGNRAFAVGLVRYLMQGSAGRLFVIGNDFAESGVYPTMGGWRAEAEEKLEAVAQVLRRLGADGLAGAAGFGLAAMVALGVGLWTTSVASRPYRRRLPSFARAVPLVAQGGLAGRAAVLSAPSTPSALAVLELKAALQEGLSQELGLAGATSPVQLLEAVKSKDKLDEPRQVALRRVLLEMAEIETLVGAGQTTKTKKEDVGRIARVVFDVLGAARARGHAGSQSSSWLSLPK
jgi:hypothetical protein